MRDPAVLFYTKDFLSGTAFFTDAERGQYIRLLCEQHQNGHIPENHLLSVSFSLASPVVKKFVRDKDGYYFNERMELEIEKRNKFTESRSINGKKGGRPIKEEKASAKPLGYAKNNLVGDGNGNGNKNGIAIDFILPEFQESFNLWIQYKKERRESYKSDKSIKVCYEELVRLSKNKSDIAMKIVRQSMANNWAGLFELKQNKNNNSETHTASGERKLAI